MLDVSTTLPVRAMPDAISFYEAAGFHVYAYDGSFAFVKYAGLASFQVSVREAGPPVVDIPTDRTEPERAHDAMIVWEGPECRGVLAEGAAGRKPPTVESGYCGVPPASSARSRNRLSVASAPASARRWIASK